MKVGDRVRHKYSQHGTGIVVAIKPEQDYSVWVRLDKASTLDNVGLFKEDHLELIKPGVY